MLDVDVDKKKGSSIEREEREKWRVGDIVREGGSPMAGRMLIGLSVGLAAGMKAGR